MYDNITTACRRILLKSIVSGFGAVVAGKSLPKSWSKPVVDSVMLPAHAETTGGSVKVLVETPTWYSDDFTFGGIQAQTLLLEDALSVLVQDAQASCLTTQGSMCVDTRNAPAFKAQVLVTDGFLEALYTGVGTIEGGAAKLSFTRGCNWFGEVTIAVSTPGENGVDYTVTSCGGFAVANDTAPPGQICPSLPEGDCPG